MYVWKNVFNMTMMCECNLENYKNIRMTIKFENVCDV